MGAHEPRAAAPRQPERRPRRTGQPRRTSGHGRGTGLGRPQNPRHPTTAPGRTGRRPPRRADKVIDNIDHAIQDLRDLDDTDGSGTKALEWAGGLWQATARIVNGATGDNANVRRLHTAFIELSEQYGWMAFDNNLHPQAQRIYHTGMRLAAEKSPHPAARHATSNLLASAAYQAAWLGQHAEATVFLTVAERTNTAAGTTPALAAVIAERRLFAAGRCGDTEDLRRASDTAHEQLDKTGLGSGAPWWCQWLSHTAIDAATGRAWLAARQPHHAEPYLTRRVTATSLGYPRDHMLAVLDLADAHRQSGDTDRATQLHDTATTLAEHVDSPRAQLRLQQLATALTH
ncbi:XRE family transcriptional regulator [Streptomyces sp. NPDC001787]|uniref:XRE family transcriptional regulator n=1 Tax=Streptomyces sp. NPDC001787 TaxID=3154523 RepID=UPI003328477E